MKYAIIFVTLLLSLSGGYWYGYGVGYEQGIVLNTAENALAEIEDINAIKLDSEVNFKDLHEVKINRSLVKYGEYLENESYYLPVFYSAEPAINDLFGLVVEYRKGNLRKVNGVEYSPFKASFKSSNVYKQLPLEGKNRVALEEHYYERALERK